MAPDPDLAWHGGAPEPEEHLSREWLDEWEGDPRATDTFREVMGRFATGVTVVTGLAGGEPVGLTCQSFTSVSLDPPLVLFCPARTSRAWPLIHRSGSFCVNLLAHDQVDLADRMAGKGTDKFAGIDWVPAPETGSPLLRGTLGHVDCAIHAVHEAGDHFLVLGRVLDLAATAAPHALLYYQGRYGATGG